LDCVGLTRPHALAFVAAFEAKDKAHLASPAKALAAMRKNKSSSKHIKTMPEFIALQEKYKDGPLRVPPSSDLSKRLTLSVNRQFGGKFERAIAASDNKLKDRDGTLDAAKTDAQEPVESLLAACKAVCEATGVRAILALDRLGFRRSNIRGKCPQFKSAVASLNSLVQKHKARSATRRAEIEEEAGGMVRTCLFFVPVGGGCCSHSCCAAHLFVLGFVQSGLMMRFATRVGQRVAEINAANQAAEDSDDLADLDVLVLFVDY
jgi:hypothetical protein